MFETQATLEGTFFLLKHLKPATMLSICERGIEAGLTKAMASENE